MVWWLLRFVNSRLRQNTARPPFFPLILKRKVVFCRHFNLRAVRTFRLMSRVGIYSGRASENDDRLLPKFLFNYAAYLRLMFK